MDRHQFDPLHLNNGKETDHCAEGGLFKSDTSHKTLLEELREKANYHKPSSHSTNPNAKL